MARRIGFYKLALYVLCLVNVENGRIMRMSEQRLKNHPSLEHKERRMTNLFNHIPKGIKLSSGKESNFKIDCDALTDEDVECIAWLIKEKVGKFHCAWGVRSGGIRLKYALRKYECKNTDENQIILIVDDVLTTGTSMERTKMQYMTGWDDVKGVVIFARGKCPDWITPLFQMEEEND